MSIRYTTDESRELALVKYEELKWQVGVYRRYLQRHHPKIIKELEAEEERAKSCRRVSQVQRAFAKF